MARKILRAMYFADTRTFAEDLVRLAHNRGGLVHIFVGGASALNEKLGTSDLEDTVLQVRSAILKMGVLRSATIAEIDTIDEGARVVVTGTAVMTLPGGALFKSAIYAEIW